MQSLWRPSLNDATQIGDRRVVTVQCGGGADGEIIQDEEAKGCLERPQKVYGESKRDRNGPFFVIVIVRKSDSRNKVRFFSSFSRRLRN